jgi:DNA-binding NarL/FixJ family response regulator
MSRYRVLVADDHPTVLERVSEILSHDYDVVAAVGDGLAAVDAAATLLPDVVVLDISMPVLSGFEAAARLSGCPRTPRIVFLTMHEDPAFVEAARNVGASAYVLKRTIAAQLLPAIKLALEGHAVFPASDERKTFGASTV